MAVDSGIPNSVILSRVWQAVRTSLRCASSFRGRRCPVRSHPRRAAPGLVSAAATAAHPALVCGGRGASTRARCSVPKPVAVRPAGPLATTSRCEGQQAWTRRWGHPDEPMPGRTRASGRPGTPLAVATGC